MKYRENDLRYYLCIPSYLTTGTAAYGVTFLKLTTQAVEAQTGGSGVLCWCLFLQNAIRRRRTCCLGLNTGRSCLNRDASWSIRRWMHLNLPSYNCGDLADQLGNEYGRRLNQNKQLVQIFKKSAGEKFLPQNNIKVTGARVLDLNLRHGIAS